MPRLHMLAVLLILASMAPSQATIDFTASPTRGKNPLVVDFEATVTGPTPLAIAWDFGDGISGVGEEVTHTFGLPGTFTVSVTALLPDLSTITATQRDLIGVDPAVFTADFTASPMSGLLPLEVSFTGISMGDLPTGWFWEFGDGDVSSRQDPTHVYETPGTYDVTLTAKVGQQGESVTKERLITVDPVPLEADFAADVTTGLPKLTVAFMDTTTGVAPTGWMWNFGDFTTSVAQNPTHTYDQPGTYTVTLTAKFFGQSNVIEKVDFITVTNPPVPMYQVVSHPASDSTTWFDVGDLDGDGHVDAVSASTSSEDLLVHPGIGLGALGEPFALSDGFHGLPRLVDMTGDGFLDLVVIDSTAEALEVWVNDGGGTLAQVTSFGRRSLGWFDVGDVSSDGIPDVVIDADDQVLILLGVGNGGLAPAATVDVADGSILGLLTRDFDSDGSGDVAALTFSAQAFETKLVILLGDGTGAGFAQEVIPTFPDVAIYVESADLDGDADLDLVLSGGNSPIVYLGDGQGGFSGAATLDVPTGPGPFGVGFATAGVIGDADGDGICDVVGAGAVYAEFDIDGPMMFLGVGDGTFLIGVFLDEMPVSTDMAMLDVNDDGALDLVVRRIDGPLQTLVNQGGPWTAILADQAPPVLLGGGPGLARDRIALGVSGASPDLPALLVVGTRLLMQPLGGGVLLAAPDLVLPIAPLDAEGSALLDGRLPPLAPGIELYFQVWLMDGSDLVPTNGQRLVITG